MDLHHCYQRGIEVVSLWFLSVEYVYWIGAARDGEDRLEVREGEKRLLLYTCTNKGAYSFVEIGGEFDSIKSGRGHNQLQFWTLLHSLHTNSHTQKHV